ncbi:hypothetical protein VTN96DRAFT_9845 [Rasamsonia emersonii]
MQTTIQSNLEKAATATAATPARQIEYVDTIQAYDQWAEIYDTDGNFLQALDTIEMRSLIPSFLSRIMKEGNPPLEENDGSSSRCIPKLKLKLIDLGCGTGRNTLQLLAFAPSDAEIVGLDASRGMLDVARGAVERWFLQSSSSSSRNMSRVTLQQYDLLLSLSQQQCPARDASGIISTLVLEHIPLDMFFAHATSLLRPGGYLLVTNMHADMGALSQAGFVDRASGKKIRPERSYCHRVPDVIAAAAQEGFEVVVLNDENTTGDGAEGVRERSVTEEMVDVLGPRARKWVGVTVWFGVCFRKKFGL